MLCGLDDRRANLEVEGGVRESDVDSFSTLDGVTHNERDGSILFRQSTVKGIVDEI